jgi:Flp pilus assembly protein TadG
MMMRRFRKILADWRDDSGLAAIEFALIAPLVAVILAGTVDYGCILFNKFKLDESVNAAANYAMVSNSQVNASGGATLAGTLATLVATSHGSGWADVTVTVNDGPVSGYASGTQSSSGTASPADSCYCPTGAATSVTWGAAQTCNASCAGGGYAGKFVLVSATRAYSPLFSAGYGVINGRTLTSATLVQVQ